MNFIAQKSTDGIIDRAATHFNADLQVIAQCFPGLEQKSYNFLVSAPTFVE